MLDFDFTGIAIEDLVCNEFHIRTALVFDLLLELIFLFEALKIRSPVALIVTPFFFEATSLDAIVKSLHSSALLGDFANTLFFALVCALTVCIRGVRSRLAVMQREFTS